MGYNWLEIMLNILKMRNALGQLPCVGILEQALAFIRLQYLQQTTLITFNAFSGFRSIFSQNLIMPLSVLIYISLNY